MNIEIIQCKKCKKLINENEEMKVIISKLYTHSNLAVHLENNPILRSQYGAAMKALNQ